MLIPFTDAYKNQQENKNNFLIFIYENKIVHKKKFETKRHVVHSEQKKMTPSQKLGFKLNLFAEKLN